MGEAMNCPAGKVYTYALWERGFGAGTVTSEATRLRKARYKRSAKGKATARAARVRYRQSEKGKAANARYGPSEKGRAARKRYRVRRKERSASG